MNTENTLAALFSRQAMNTPSVIAIQQGERTLTYDELDQRTNQLGRYLQSLGVGPDKLVAICLEQSLDLIVAILGVLKAGGAYVPLDPAYPTERLNYMIDDSSAVVLITTSSIKSRIAEKGVAVVFSDEIGEILQQFDGSVLQSTASLDNLAYVMYTSGSTGRPKGVMVEQRGWANYVRAAQQTYHLQPGERMLQFASISWDTSAEEIFPCLTSGATLVLRMADMTDSIPRFLEYCAAWHVTCINLPTAFWHELVSQMYDADLPLPSSLRVVIIGGERTRWEFLEKWLQIAPPHVQLFNTYGQTECTAVTTCGELTPAQKPGVVSLGAPIENVRVYILNDHFQPVAEGESGELYVGGPGVARGYLNQPELTARKFLDNPFENFSEVFYRTGDLVRRLPDGDLEFVGRTDQLVKIRGVRIEPGEIENTLAQHPAVKTTVVVGYPTGPSPEYLAAYVVRHAQVSATSEELRNWLFERLPAFMVPACLLFLDSLPLTPNGKLDRQALLVPDFSQLTAGPGDNGPMTDTQAELMLIWQDVLGLTSIGLHDDFFALGGHSLLATRVIARIRQRFKIDLPLITMFEGPTIAEQSQHLLANVAGVHDEPPLVPRSPGDPLQPSYAQESLWFLDQLVPGNPAYNISDALALSGPLEIPALESAINLLVERHEILRMRFENVDGQPLPVVEESLKIPLSVVDVSVLPLANQIEHARQMATEEALRPFDLHQGPLLRFLLLRLAPDHHILTVVTHHIISDGWSIAVFYQELSELYSALVSDRPASLPTLPVQFTDYALWQRRYLRGERLETHLAYWRENLHQVTPLQFPLDHPREAQRSYRGTRLPITFSAEFTSRLQALARSENVTVFMILLAALQTLILRYSAQTDITVGTVVANRHQPELEGLIGYFINTLVLRTDLKGIRTFHELLLRVKETTLGAYAHQTVPFDMVVHALRPQRAANRNPLFDIMLFLQNVPVPKLDLPDIQAEFLELEQRSSEFDFVIDLTESPDGLQGFCEFNTALFEPATMQRLVGHFQSLLNGAVDQPDTLVAMLPMLSPAESRQLLDEWNQTQCTYPDVGTIPDLFEAQVRRWPDKIIAIQGSTRLSYAELNLRANRLAHALIDLGVQKESVVGICLNRSLDLLVSVLAVLKAGAAYLPLDPAYPMDRLNFMLADSQAAWLVTHSAQRSLFSTYAGRVIDLEGDASGFEYQAATDPVRDLNGENACYVIYTSGSTGQPKGVVGLHRAALNRFQWMWDAYPFGSDEVCCQKTPLSFVDSVWEILGPLLGNCPLVIIPDNEMKDLRKFVEALAKYHVSRLVVVPSLLRVMLETFPDLGQRVPELRLWVSSGEALTQDLVNEFLQCLPGRILLNLYGSSEVAADSTYFEIRQPGTPVCIGRPIANTQVYILDALRQLAPIGVVGEIYIGGQGLARGYWHRLDLSAERFVVNPFKNDPQARLFKTGDLGRYLPDGQIEYLGRADFQVKIRGFRVELGEIQNVLLQHPDVKQVLVQAQEQRLVAYVVPNPGMVISPASLRSFAATLLPDFMLPAAWVIMDAFPLTPNGKIDQQALQAAGTSHSDMGQIYVAPGSELELRLVKIWDDLLGVSPIGVDDNFFEIGGHSLLVVRLMTILEKELGKPLSLALIFHAPTVRQMAEILRDHGWKPAWSSLVPIRPQGRNTPLFCVHADGGAFFYVRFSEYLSPDQPFYGLQARGLDGTELPFSNIEDMAAHYLKEIRTVQPHGPYMISGFSMGGVVIYEMARQLIAAGEPPPLVVFLDAPSPAYFEEQDLRLGGKLINLTRLPLRERLRRVRHRLQQRSQWLIDETLSRLYIHFHRSLTPSLRIHRVREMNHRIADNYDPLPYLGPVTVLRARDESRRAGMDFTLGWGDLVVGKISVHEIPGDHETIFFEPNVGIMANTLQACIDQWRKI